MVFSNWLVQAIVAGVVLAFLGWMVRPLRRWLVRRWRALWRWVRDLRVTRESVIEARIAAAVAAAREPEVNDWPPPIRLKVPTEAEFAAEAAAKAAAKKAELIRRTGWHIRVDRSRPRAYTLTNVSVGDARDVRLSDGASGTVFALDSAPLSWVIVREGETVPFEGRVTDPGLFRVFGRELRIEWRDDHDDEQQKLIPVDYEEETS